MISYNKISSLLIPFKTRLRILFYGLYNPRWYPANIKDRHYKINTTQKNSYLIDDLSKLIVRLDMKSGKIITQINLAGRTSTLVELEKIWKRDFKRDFDSEVSNASFRFHWLLEEIIKNEYSSEAFKFIQIINNWYSLDESDLHSDAFQPYNVSERICNISTFILLMFKSKLISKSDLEFYQDAILKDLNRLNSTLEYPASGKINNHILNNARALIMGGVFIGNMSYVELSKQIFKTHLPKMISTNGYLMECSSHYQLLLTRSIFEVSRISSILSDKEFTDWITDYSKRMVTASLRLTPDSENNNSVFPNIGDVSPDIPLNWLSLKRNASEGWNKIWNKPHFKPGNYTSFFDEEDWIVVEKGDWFGLSFSHNNNLYPSGHGHDDFGSFVLSFQGQPLISDLGRVSYDYKFKDSGKENFLHSVPLLNKDINSRLVSFFERHGILEDSTRRYLKTEKEHLKWITKHKDYHWERNLQTELNEINIIDSIRIESLKSSRIHGYFYLSPACHITTLDKDLIKININKLGDFEFKFEGIEEIRTEVVSFFPEYGVTVPTNRIEWITSEDSLQKVETNIRKT